MQEEAIELFEGVRKVYAIDMCDESNKIILRYRVFIVPFTQKCENI